MRHTIASAEAQTGQKHNQFSNLGMPRPLHFLTGASQRVRLARSPFHFSKNRSSCKGKPIFCRKLRRRKSSKPTGKIRRKRTASFVSADISTRFSFRIMASTIRFATRSGDIVRSLNIRLICSFNAESLLFIASTIPVFTPPG